MSIIVNTTVLSNFAVIGHLALLHRLYPQLYISTDVYAEIEDGVLAGYDYLAEIQQYVQPFTADGWIVLTSPTAPDEIAHMATLPARLHRGEASSLVIAARRGWLFLTDDRSARAIAQAQGIHISGTVGCLLLGIRQQHWSIADANQWLTLMIGEGYRSPVDDLQLVIDAQQ